MANVVVPFARGLAAFVVVVLLGVDVAGCVVQVERHGRAKLVLGCKEKEHEKIQTHPVTLPNGDREHGRSDARSVRPGPSR